MSVTEKRSGTVNLAAAYATDRELEIAGVWSDVQVGETDSGEPIMLRCKIARYNNHRFQDRMRALTKPLKFQIDNDNLRSAEADKLVDQVMADTVLNDWEGKVNLGDDVELEYSRANALLAFQKLPDFRDDIKARAQARELYRKQQIAADSGN